MESNIQTTGVRVYTFIDENNHDKEGQTSWWYQFCLRCHQADPTPSWQPSWWAKMFPFPIFPTFRQSAQQLCIILFFFLVWGILYAEIGEAVSLNGELLSMTILVIAAYLIGWIWLKITTLPALIGMLLTGIMFQNLHLVHMTDEYRKLNQDLRKIALVIILTRAGLGLDAGVLKKHYIAVLQIGLIPWLVECVAISVTTHFLLGLPWIWAFLLGSMIASVSPAVVVPCLFRLRDAGFGVSKGIPTLLLAAAAIDDSISVAVFAIILNAMFSTGSMTFNIIKGPLSIIVGVVLGSLWGAFASIIPERGDVYVVPLRFLALFLGGLFSLFISSLIGWSGAGPLAIVSSGFIAAYYWDKQGWPVNKNPVSNLFRILWIFFEPILFAFTGAQITVSALDPQVIAMGAVCLVSCLLLRVIATFLISFGCGLNNKEKLFIGLTWLAKATVQAALGPAALDLVHNGQTAGNSSVDEERYAKAILAVSVLSVVISAPIGAILIALAGPRLLSRDSQVQDISIENENKTIRNTSL
ncbi:sodium/hydrogen exchanger 9B2-like isoform X1 [Vanessa cardui]|uniref:sodium/hydrogen exchanger 9B2-like isoform X1 n=1 Tax=Vanessa cardui TaxID=171605 RepID=UPI001F14226C|nr:sodium/hydrogen exchanger 9B2-like isoform X1 [Vanessa cardui]XP_046962129.1 sodium/hydrogen exchanger 9B2-like isoform X1 [Vanessa cardui]